ncbi:MAG TPA: response regulator, partial [Streptosporangiaceae bacterium]|nr:response regulator [Streptosporangiaceae bacterium]
MTLRSASSGREPPGNSGELPAAGPRSPGGDGAAATGIPGRRILVVDDFPALRAVAGRALRAHGFIVDTAGSLAEARRLDPGGYDAVIVDARLGPDDGTDLVAELTAADPAAASRCLIITGAGLGTHPAGVAVLAKPFEVAELVSAVSGMLTPAARAPGPPDRPGPAAHPRRSSPQRQPQGSPQWQPPGGPQPQPQGGPQPQPPGGPRRPPPGAAGPVTARPPGPAGSRSLDLLAMIVQLRAHEQAGLAGFLHDDLVQNLAAASLELELLRRAVPAAARGRIDSALGMLGAGSQAVRQLIDDYEPVPWAAAQLAAAITRQTRWLFAGPVTVDDSGWPAPADPAEVPVIASATELLLYCLRPGDQPASARVAVRARDTTAQLDLSVTASAG